MELEQLLPLQHPVDRLAIESASDSAAVRNLIAKYLFATDEKTGRVRGPVDSRGRPRAVLKLWFAANRDFRDWLEQLGATPASRAEIAPHLVEAQKHTEAMEHVRQLQAQYGNMSKPAKRKRR